MELKNIDKLKFREENIFEHDDHDGHGHDAGRSNHVVITKKYFNHYLKQN